MFFVFVIDLTMGHLAHTVKDQMKHQEPKVSQKLTLTYLSFLKIPSQGTLWRWYHCFRCDVVWAHSPQTFTHYSLFGNSKSTHSLCAPHFRILYHCNSCWQSNLRLVATAQNVCTPKVLLLLLLLYYKFYVAFLCQRKIKWAKKKSHFFYICYKGYILKQTKTVMKKAEAKWLFCVLLDV